MKRRPFLKRPVEEHFDDFPPLPGTEPLSRSLLVELLHSGWQARVLGMAEREHLNYSRERDEMVGGDETYYILLTKHGAYEEGDGPLPDSALFSGE